MHRTPLCNFDQLAGRDRIDTALNTDRALEAINLAGSPLSCFTAIVAVLGRQLAVSDADGQATEAELFVLGIDPERHRGARGQRGCEIVLGARAAIKATHRCRLISEEMMAPSRNSILKLPYSRFRRHNPVVAILAHLRFLLRDVAGCPCRNDLCGIGRVLPAGEQVVCGIE